MFYSASILSVPFIFFFYDMSYTAMWEELDFYVEKLYNDIMLNGLWKDFIS